MENEKVELMQAIISRVKENNEKAKGLPAFLDESNELARLIAEDLEAIEAILNGD